MGQHCLARWRLSSAVVCKAPGELEVRPPGAWAVGRLTLHGEPVRSRPVRATPCFWRFWCWKVTNNAVCLRCCRVWNQQRWHNFVAVRMYVYHAQHPYFDETKLAPTDDTIRLWNVKRQGHTLNLCDGESIHAELSPSSIIHVTVVFVSYDCTSATLPRWSETACMRSVQSGVEAVGSCGGARDGRLGDWSAAAGIAANADNSDRRSRPRPSSAVDSRVDVGQSAIRQSPLPVVCW